MCEKPRSFFLQREANKAAVEKKQVELSPPAPAAAVKPSHWFYPTASKPSTIDDITESTGWMIMTGGLGNANVALLQKGQRPIDITVALTPELTANAAIQSSQKKNSPGHWVERPDGVHFIEHSDDDHHLLNASCVKKRQAQ